MKSFSAKERAAIERAISRAEKKTSGEIVVVVASASAHYFAIGVMWAALIALGVPLPLILFTKWPVEHIYLAMLAVFALGLAPIQWEVASISSRAGIRKTGAGTPAGRRAFPGAKPAHHQGPHGRPYLRVFRRALRRGDRGR